jgi:hypothetical protein
MELLKPSPCDSAVPASLRTGDINAPAVALVREPKADLRGSVFAQAMCCGDTVIAAQIRSLVATGMVVAHGQGRLRAGRDSRYQQ